MFKAGWLCYHIDDLLHPKYRLPTVRALQQLTISKLFDQVVHGECKYTASRADAIQVQDVGDVMETNKSPENIVNVNENTVETEKNVIEMTAQPTLKQEGLEQVDFDVDELVCQCLYSATKILTDGNGRTDRKVERVHLLQEELTIRCNQGK